MGHYAGSNYTHKYGEHSVRSDNDISGIAPPGSDGGSPFNDWDNSQKAVIISMKACTGEIINKLEVTYTDGTTITHGSDGSCEYGQERNFKGRIITSVQVGTDNCCHCDPSCVSGIVFDFKDGTRTTVGNDRAVAWHPMSTPSGTYTSLYGHDGKYLDGIGFIGKDGAQFFGTPVGSYLSVGSQPSGDKSYTFSHGFSTTHEVEDDNSMKIGMGIEVKAGSEFDSTTVSFSTSAEWSHMVTDSDTKTQSTTCTTACGDEETGGRGGRLWQWGIDTQIHDGSAASVAFCDTVCTPYNGQEPQCKLGCCDRSDSYCTRETCTC